MSLTVKQRVVVFLAAAVLATAVAASGPATAQQAIGQRDIEVRDQLIANQENLLNTYRCLFGMDVHVVPGGCEDPDTVVAGAASQGPTQSDLDVRDGLIQSQEALLNDYRCLHKIDAHIVPGGCNRITVVFDLGIWVMDGDGEGAQRIVTSSEFAAPGFTSLLSNPVWSPDGSRIAFVVDYHAEPWDGISDKSDIWTVNNDGTELRVFLDGESADIQQILHLSWSPDGTKLAYQSMCCDKLGRSINSILTVADVDGSNSAQISKVPTHRAYSWSPDGTRIVYSKGLTRANWITTADGTSQSQLNSLEADYGPIWSPDGSRVAVGITRDIENRKEIWVFDADGRNQRKIASSAYTFGTPRQQGEVGFAWSFDGKQIAYFDNLGDDVVLTAIDVHSLNKRQIATFEGVASLPVWSPDGIRIAYSPGGQFVTSTGSSVVAEGLWVIFADGTNQQKLASGPIYTRDLSWLP